MYILVFLAKFGQPEVAKLAKMAKIVFTVTFERKVGESQYWAQIKGLDL